MITPRAAVFDIGKVLLDFDFQRAADALSPDSDLSPEGFRRLIDQSPLLHRFETGLISSNQFFQEVAAHSGYRATSDQFAVRFASIFSEIPEMIDLQAEFGRRGLPTYIFSNTNELAVRFMRAHFSVLSRFDGYIFSYEVGAMKPNEVIYQALETLSRLSGSQLFYMDDRPENVEAAIARGWYGHVHSDPKETWRVAAERFGWDLQKS